MIVQWSWEVLSWPRESSDEDFEFLRDVRIGYVDRTPRNVFVSGKEYVSRLSKQL